MLRSLMFYISIYSLLSHLIDSIAYYHQVDSSCDIHKEGTQ